jgi:hypothetical protein
LIERLNLCVSTQEEKDVRLVNTSAGLSNVN